MSPRQQFTDLMKSNIKAYGLDELSARIIAELFIEPDDISLEDLARRTGYSLSSTSTSIKFLEATGMINKFKKPHSKKVFVRMQKDILNVMLSTLKRKQELVIRKAKESLPEIITEYKKTKSSRRELDIVERYYHDVVIGEQIIIDIIDKIERLKK